MWVILTGLEVDLAAHLRGCCRDPTLNDDDDYGGYGNYYFGYYYYSDYDTTTTIPTTTTTTARGATLTVAHRHGEHRPRCDGDVGGSGKANPDTAAAFGEVA